MVCMLDRNTKNVDAGVELLEDRKRVNDILFIVAIVFSTSVTIIGAVFELITICTLGIAMLVVCLSYVMFNVEYKVLIQCRKIMNCQQNQILLINEALNDLDSLEDRISVRKVKKK